MTGIFIPPDRELAGWLGSYVCIIYLQKHCNGFPVLVSAGSDLAYST